ncbi:hypothetical protein P3342_002047 [Pyrenophora teres f. teres]|uniref:Uncharacterized protein n=2 Tax=Pyrenophora teres f. teres TaxID=97479 RepID=E3RJ84_PYRTT|nr:hypothetical protein PTT_08181 [Pyrenophora teres f. teres 0-1]KAE8844641.1 hypothetical protein PTNB85_02906 [Pyrenophora teres f. teres]KAE8866212.1 hypothetical protein PTNB29_03359 [Pyrenophora teres f. teres]KAK1919754.1 hypothetical protein P3342_002047 [Pyrenophora teres f. teres]CAE7178201.1 hypothetical protein PTTW11_06307 [Pyrenophora teres f. teres]
MASSSNSATAANRPARARKQALYVEVSSSPSESDQEGDKAPEADSGAKHNPDNDDMNISDYAPSRKVTPEVTAAASSSPADEPQPASPTSTAHSSSSDDEGLPTLYASTAPGDMTTFLDIIHDADEEVAQKVTFLRFSAIYDTPTNSGLIDFFGINPNTLTYSPPLEHARGVRAKMCRRLRMLLQAADKTEDEKLTVWMKVVCELFRPCAASNILIPKEWMGGKELFKQYFSLDDGETEEKGTGMVLLGEKKDRVGGKRFLEKPRDVRGVEEPLRRLFGA